MDTQKVIARAVEVIIFLFAAFSGFLKNIAPPEEANSSFAIGIGSLLALIMLLFVTVLAKNLSARKYKKVWFIAFLIFLVAAIAVSLLYKNNLEKLTFAYPPESTKAEYIGGTELTPEAMEYKEKTNRSVSGIVAGFGGLANREKVWTPDSTRKAKLILTANYIALVLSFAGCIFCLTERFLGKSKPKPADKAASR